MATKLAIRDDAQANAFLHRDGGADGRVLRRAQLIRRRGASGVALAQFEQFGRPQQAADMLGAKWRMHVPSPCSIRAPVSRRAAGR